MDTTTKKNTLKHKPVQNTKNPQSLFEKLHELPIYTHKQDILGALEKSQVVVVESNTGSGKTTQLPIILHEVGYTTRGVVGMTQPRRIAAFSTADIIRMQVRHSNEALPKSFVEYKIRFDDPTTQDTRIKIMTDGVLLQEIKHTPHMNDYSVIIVDEAHERSLNIDFTLGLLRNVCEVRKDLKIIISSATINSSVFSKFFFDCPIVSVHAPLHKVDIRYLPIKQEKTTSKKPPKKSQEKNKKKSSLAVSDEVLVQHIVALVESAVARDEGDILVFLSGEKHIKMCMEGFDTLACAQSLHVLPLYGRLDKETQSRVFTKTPQNKTKVVVATNIAETSITIDNIAVVIDSGKAKVNSFLHAKFASILEEIPISRASAIQRCGRAGRTRAGICYRLYSKREFENMAQYTQEEIYRTDLSEVVLRMAQIGIQDFQAFTFISAPQKSAIHAAVKTLTSLDALDDKQHITSTGTIMGDFPLSPMHAKIVIEAMQCYPDALYEVLVVVSFLTTPNPFLLPIDAMTEARAKHRSFAIGSSDFLLYLNLFNRYTQSRKKSVHTFCAAHYLDAQIMEEIFNVYTQLEDIVRSHGILFTNDQHSKNTKHNEEAMMKAILRGFAYNVCLRDENARGGKSYINRSAEKIFVHPGSVLFDCPREKTPVAIVAGEIVSTSRYFARSIAPCEIAWLKESCPDIYDAAVELGHSSRKEKHRPPKEPYKRTNKKRNFRTR